MLTLGNLFVLMLLAAAAAWLWHGHGIRERALTLIKQHCSKLDIELLDGNVAFQRFGIVRDGRGNRRFARVYGFEFTVTGEQRHGGRIVMFGAHLGNIELDPYPFREPAAALPPTPTPTPTPTTRQSGQVIELQQWRRDHPTPRE
ncbi:DUF3301 domain-containing protein [Pseudomonas daroniae]|uniref:DUF3301 domain-containing protein n=1 Tax=Phytopseudomonas daroniae TaxID=2487519 RepID=A0A4Q9QHV2_9GAMM|nr:MULTISPECIES: DUF3301 domain-containing protein [Pseudomonas]TBU73057.1 DUF3301 domain-containing protein [Pseudomonas daroniae]TBU77830.1 DUF3301 domain-containing protein [Pseudomonas sp. FRB 228]TBU87829.1 DUF3301 domain-containing protein [Pseudomonas daroniae]